MYREMKKNIENSAAATSRAVMFVPVSVRLEKMPKLTSGAEERSSINTKLARSASDSAPRPSVCAEPQPASLASTSV